MSHYRAASSLDHLNICPIYEFGEHEGQPFIVMQLLEGQTLRDRLSAGEGALLLEELLDIGIQVSDGLQAAHERGIIHRDIKPANIFLTSKGVCKVLDFGVAKLLEMGDEGELEVQAATSAVPSPAASAGLALTRTGIALGTAGYMSTEQVRGEELDARTDLFSFGLVLYEMATGQRAFRGEIAEIARDAIVHHPQIPVRDFNSSLPRELETIINRALEKDREVRYQTAAEMGADLKRLHGGVETKQMPRPYSRLLLLGGAAIAIVLLALGLGLHWLKGQPVVPRKTLSERLLTHNPSENPVENAAISPDGRYVAYADNKGLHLSVIETGESHDLPLPEELRTHLWAVTWFPDGEKLILTADSDAEGKMIWTTSVFGGIPHNLGSGGNWPAPVASPQGSSIAFVGRHDHEIWVMGANGENPHKILGGGNDRYAALAWSPNGQRLAYIRTAEGQAGGSIETLSLDGGPPSEVISDPQLVNAAPGLVWTHDGRMIFVKGEGSLPDSTNLWESMIDPLDGKPSAKASKITNWDGLFTYSPTISQDAHRLGVMKTHIREDIYVGELQDGGTRLASPKRVTVSESLDFASGWMHDGKTILFESNRTGRSQVFRQQMEQSTPEPLIMGPDDEEGAELSPDGLWILYWSSARGGDSPAMVKRLMRFPAVGGHPEQVLEVKDPDAAFACPIRPSSSCVISHWDRGQLIFYALDAIRGQGKELAKTELGSSKNLDWSVSPEGLRIGVLIKDHLPKQVQILDLQNGAERNLPLPHGWNVWSLSWTADGNALFAAARSTTYFIVRIELDGKTRVLLNGNANQSIDSPHPSPDGGRLVFSQRTAESNAWLLENF